MDIRGLNPHYALQYLILSFNAIEIFNPQTIDVHDGKATKNG